MGPLTSPEMELRYIRRRRWRMAGLIAVFAVMVGVVALLALAYARQSEQVDDLEAQNGQILSQHKAIGATFAKQSEKFEQQSKKLESALRTAYDKGFVAGKRASSLPKALRPLARYAALGLLVPTRLPSDLAAKHPHITGDFAGYTLRWRGVTIFASRVDPLRIWTRQALGATPRSVTLGSHHVRRLIGPGGVIYAWREKGTTYGVLTLPGMEAAARLLIASMR
jgi:nitrogen fixation-related uncharacterized protein